MHLLLSIILGPQFEMLFTTSNLHYPFIKLYASDVEAILIKCVFIVCQLSDHSIDYFLY